MIRNIVMMASSGPANKARYWRVTMESGATDAPCEIELLTSDSYGAAITVADPNSVIAGITGVATGSITNSPVVLTDGNLIYTSYVYNWAIGDHITWDCGTPKEVNFMRLCAYSDLYVFDTCKVSYSHDNVNWVDSTTFDPGTQAAANQFTASNYIALTFP